MKQRRAREPNHKLGTFWSERTQGRAETDPHGCIARRGQKWKWRFEITETAQVSSSKGCAGRGDLIRARKIPAKYVFEPYF